MPFYYISSLFNNLSYTHKKQTIKRIQWFLTKIVEKASEQTFPPYWQYLWCRFWCFNTKFSVDFFVLTDKIFSSPLCVPDWTGLEKNYDLCLFHQNLRAQQLEMKFFIDLASWFWRISFYVVIFIAIPWNLTTLLVSCGHWV